MRANRIAAVIDHVEDVRELTHGVMVGLWGSGPLDAHDVLSV